MPPSVVPLSAVSADLLREFLMRMGMSREVAEWRYLDANFNRGRNRGYAWVRHNRIEGMIGLIPFNIVGPGPTRTVNWSSDWMLADPTSNPGMGILLLRQAIESSTELFAFGGNENTTKLLPRIATHTVPDAGMSLHLPLRLGVVLRRLEKQRMLDRLPKPKLLYMIPLRWVPKSGRSAEVATERGLSPRLTPLLELEGGTEWAPRYDFADLEWQVGRSPFIQCWTSYTPSVGEPVAAAVYWRPAFSSDFWRLAVWSHPGQSGRLELVIREAVATIYRLGGMAVSTIVSRLDLELQRCLHSAGFLTLGRSRPLYVCAGREGTAVRELRGLSYLDTDLAYRF
ncbi:MAG TPA: hypothetical protein VGN76_08950 [Gemmatimonadales bacterium]|nr:hypothetical protein [Gemmatimonadales bacterium]